VSKLTIHVGGGLEVIGERVKDAVRRDQEGERVREYHLTFDSFETLAKVLTPRRLGAASSRSSASCRIDSRARPGPRERLQARS
jgi:predicted transcriptional regulator